MGFPSSQAAVGALVALLGLGGMAHAQVVAEPVSPYPDPALFARGLYLEAEAGAVIPLGPARSIISAGPALGVTAGYDLARFAALEAAALGSTHSVDVAGGPQVGQLLQMLQLGGGLKLALPIGAWSIVLQGGGGYARLSTNILGTTGLAGMGVRTSVFYGGGGGVDYHTRSRHFSCGVMVAFNKLTRIATTGALNTTAYLRYTF